uniref:Uncharacterized protein n=1 Tax=Anguilla anguilla TaxID=7936 RepID=A0A0E9SRR0_ANGAN
MTSFSSRIALNRKHHVSTASALPLVVLISHSTK